MLEYRRRVDAAVYAWDRLPGGQTFAGPAIVEAVDSTVYVPTGFTAAVDPWGNIVAEDARDAN